MKLRQGTKDRRNNVKQLSYETIDLYYYFHHPILDRTIRLRVMRKYNIYYTNAGQGTLLECRQCRKQNKEEATREAELYKAWAECHYECEVSYKILSR